MNFDEQKFIPQEHPTPKRKYRYTVDDTVHLQNIFYLVGHFLLWQDPNPDTHLNLDTIRIRNTTYDNLGIILMRLAFASVSSFGEGMEGGTFLYLERYLSDTLWKSGQEYIPSFSMTHQNRLYKYINYSILCMPRISTM